MNGLISRRRVVVGGVALGLTVIGARLSRGASKPAISVHKSPT